MERGMVRRPSTTESSASSGCDVTFDDVDDSQVFAYLDDGDDHASPMPASPRTVEFRLDFSSRVNPSPPVASTSPTASMTRRSSINSLTATLSKQTPSPLGSTAGRVLQRSPSMRSNTSTLPVRQRLSRRPSEPASDAAIVAATAKVSNLRLESPPNSPVSSSPPSVEQVLPTSVGPSVTPSPKLSGSPTSKPSVLNVEDAVASAHHHAMIAAASEINKLQAENKRLREEVENVRSNAVDVLERARLAEQQSESISDQLLALQEAYEAKLRCAYDNAAVERDELIRQNELELHAARERSEEERDLLEREMNAAIAKIESELQRDADQLQRLLRDGKEQTNALKSQIAMLDAELQTAHAEKLQFSQSDASLTTKCESLQRTADHWEEQCQCLQDQVHQLLHEQDDGRRRNAAEKEANKQKWMLQRAIQERFTMHVQLLQSQLKILATETRELIQAEVKKTTQLFTRLQQQASEVAIQHNEKAMALVAKQNRIIQLETQLKNERQCVVQLDLSLAKTTRTMQKNDELFRAKYQEQKEFLDITVAVRNGLTHELQTKKKRLDDLEIQCRDLVRARDTTEKKNKHLVQQVKIMQHVHAREMEQVAVERQQEMCTARRRGSVGSYSPSDAFLHSRRKNAKGAMATTGNTSRGVAASYKFSSLVRDPLPGSASISTVTEGTDAVQKYQDRGEHGRDRERDQEEEHRQRCLPEGEVFAAEEWTDFVEIAALHEAECRYQQQYQNQSQRMA